jgi:hypothetical protein
VVENYYFIILSGIIEEKDFVVLHLLSVPGHRVDVGNRLNRYLFIDLGFQFLSRYFGTSEEQLWFLLKCQVGQNRLA